MFLKQYRSLLRGVLHAHQWIIDKENCVCIMYGMLQIRFRKACTPVFSSVCYNVIIFATNHAIYGTVGIINSKQSGFPAYCMG